MAKKSIKVTVKLNLVAGKATTGTPVGPILGQHGVNTANFCKAYNDQTKDFTGDILPVKVTIFDDRSFIFELKTPPASFLIKKYSNIEKGSSNTKKYVAGHISLAVLQKIYEQKKNDLTASNFEAAKKIILGTAKNMGIFYDPKLI